MKQTNTLVVGQGIAGSLVAFMLYLQKIPFVVMDPLIANTSSRIAAGMFTPVSGKRKTIHPLVLEQIPFALKTYQEIEQLLGVTILHELNIYQVYKSVQEREEMKGKLARPDFANHIITDPGPLPGIRQETGGYGITHSGWVDCGLMIHSFTNWLKKAGTLIQAEFIYEDLQVGIDRMKYHGLEFQSIVFCEGYRAQKNPFFRNVGIIPCKGDILTIKCDQLGTSHIIKKNGVYLIPTGKDMFMAGSTYRWNDDSEQPDEEGLKQLEEQLDEMLVNKYTTISHKSAVRPTTQNREPIARQHPGHGGIFMLNGLGTKGILLGPWWAKKMATLCLR